MRSLLIVLLVSWATLGCTQRTTELPVASETSTRVFEIPEGEPVTFDSLAPIRAEKDSLNHLPANGGEGGIIMLPPRETLP